MPLGPSSSPKESTPEPRNGDSSQFLAKRPSVTKIEDRLVNFELKSSTSDCSEGMGNGRAKKDLPKVDITKRREMFEREKTPEKANRSSGDFGQALMAAAPMMSIKERLGNLERQREETSSGAVNTNRPKGEITSIKHRLRNLERDTQNGQAPACVAPKFDVPLGGSIKDRLSSLHSAKSGGAAHEVPEPTATEADTASPTTAVVVAMAKKPQPTAIEEPAIEVASLQIQIEQLQLAGPASSLGPPESLVAMDSSIQDAVQDYVMVVQDVKEKEEYREITDEDLFGGTDIDGEEGDDVEMALLQQDMSVSSATDTIVSPSLADTSDSLEDISQLQRAPVVPSSSSGADKTNGVQVLETLTILGNLLERSASNNDVVGDGASGGGSIKGDLACGANKNKNNNDHDRSSSNNNNWSSGSCSNKSRPVVRPAMPIPQSLSENCLVATNRANNNHHQPPNVAHREQRPPALKSSQSAFFDTHSGDRFCVLMIDNSRR